MTSEVRLNKASTQIKSAVEKEIAARRALYQERDIVMHRLRRYRLMRQRVWVPKAYQRQFGGEKALKMPLIYRLVQTAVNAVAKGPPTIYCEPLDAQDQRAADELGRALNLLAQSQENQSAVPLLYSLYFNLFGDGLGVLKTQAGPWAGFPLPTEQETGTPEQDAVYLERVRDYMADNPLPFVTRTVDPLTAYPPLDEYGRGVFMESGWRSLQEVLRSASLTTAQKSDNGLSFERVPDGKPWPDLEFPPGLPPTVRVDEIWSKDEAAIVIQGSSDIWVFDNPQGELPYTWGFAEPTGVHDPTNVGMSIAYPLYYIQPWVDTMANIMTAWSLFAAPTPYTTRDPDPRISPTKEMKIDIYQPGKMYQFPTGVKPGILSPPPVGEQVLGYLNFLIESSDRGGLPALVSGSGVGTRLPALTFQAAFEAATDRLRPGVESAEKIIAGAKRKECNIIADSGVPVKVNGWDYEADPDNKKRTWAVIRPEEAKKRRQITVSLQVDSTQDLIAKGTHAQFMVSAQLWDMATAMRFAGVKDVQKTKDGIAADTAWRMALSAYAEMLLQTDPEFAQYQAQVAQTQADAAAEAAGQSDAVAGGGGAPEESTQLAQQSSGGFQRQSVQIARKATGTVVTGEPPDIGGHGHDKSPGDPPGPGRNRAGVSGNRGGGARGTPTHRPRGARRGR